MRRAFNHGRPVGKGIAMRRRLSLEQPSRGPSPTARTPPSRVRSRPGKALSLSMRLAAHPGLRRTCYRMPRSLRPFRARPTIGGDDARPCRTSSILRAPWRMNVGRLDDPARFLTAASPFLLEDEARHNSRRLTPGTLSGKTRTGLVSLCGFGGPTPNGIRIGPVYTPAAYRGGPASSRTLSRLG